jgi:hypothetical protein
MKRVWLLGAGAMLSLLVLEPARIFAGHGHTGGWRAVKETHEAPKHSSGKPAPHSAAKPPSKSQAKPQAKPHLKQLPKPQVKPKETTSHKQELGRSTASQHESSLHKSDVAGSVAKTRQTTHDANTTHHDGHHGWHHDRWWHGHHHVWSEEGYWVDATTGLPVVTTDGGGPVATAGIAADGLVAGPTSGGTGTGRPQIHFSVDSSERDSYDAAAQAAGMSRAEWIRNRLNMAISKELK